MREFTYEELENHIETAVNKLKNLLTGYRETGRKRAILLGYWINDYVSYLKREDSFELPKHKYNRGDIVQVNFGYRLGSELGGRHFAVVLDAHNNMNSNVVTVIPLTSLKRKTRNSVYTIILEKGLFDLQKEKFSKLLDRAEQNSNKLDVLLKNAHTEEELKIIKEELKKLENQIEAIESVSNQIDRLKSGTVAQISQITTISKMRISNPLYAKDSLNGIKLTDNDMDRISENLKKIYFK